MISFNYNIFKKLECKKTNFFMMVGNKMVQVIITLSLNFFLVHIFFVCNRMIDRSVDGVMLKKINGSGYQKKEKIYEDYIGRACPIIRKYGAN